MKRENKKSPSWYASNYRGSWDWEKNKRNVLHEKPLRCPYCGKTLEFYTQSYYGSHSSDWYWECAVCHLRLPNRREFPEEELTRIRKHYRESLEKQMKEFKKKYKVLREIYDFYGKYFTPKEKRDRLIEAIEEFKSEPF